MALSKTSIEKLKKLGVDVDAIVSAATSESEVDVAIPDGHFFTEEQLTVRDNTKYNEGKIAGEEMSVGEVKKAYNLSFTGKKVEGLVKHLTERPKEENEVITKLQKNISDMEAEKNRIASEFTNYKVRSSVKSAIPQLNNGLSADETLSVLEANGYTFTEKNGKVIAMYKGNPVTDNKMLTELEAKDVITSFLNEKKWIGQAEPEKVGRGAGNNAFNGSKPVFTSAKEVEQYWKETKGADSVNGSEYATFLKDSVKAAQSAGQTFSFA